MAELADFFDQLPEAEKSRWYRQQEGIAAVLIAGLIRFVGRPSAHMDSTEPSEIVSETIMRILAGKKRYCWDGKDPPTLDKFFARCMRTTISSFQSKAKGEQNGRASLERELPNDDLESSDEQSHRSEVAAEIIMRALASSRRRGKTREYLLNLQTYVENQSTPKQIAIDLGVKIASVDTIRRRARSELGLKVSQKESDVRLGEDRHE